MTCLCVQKLEIVYVESGFMSHNFRATNMIINVLYLFKMLPVLIVGAWCLDVG